MIAAQHVLQRLRRLFRSPPPPGTPDAAHAAPRPAPAPPAAMQPVPDAIAELRAITRRWDQEDAADRLGRSWVAMERQRQRAREGTVERDARGRFIAANRGSEGDINR